jgi:hypothetical protein
MGVINIVVYAKSNRRCLGQALALPSSGQLFVTPTAWKNIGWYEIEV